MDSFKHFGMKRRIVPECNYNAIWSNLKTIRLGEGVAKELPPDNAEFYDVSLGNKCTTGKCPFCLPEDTLIITIDGKKQIKDIKENDMIISYNIHTNQPEIQKVNKTSERIYEGDLIEIETSVGAIKCTPNHKVFTINRGYIEAQYLQLDDELLDI